jgi:NAD(P)-dependent dehydrogenase (short-subunit alcohol dehydrogenase family)
MVIAVQADVSSKESVISLVEEIESREKCLCILVNNAGISAESHQTAEAKSATELRDSLFQQSEFVNWTDVYRTNVAAAYFTTAAFLPLLQASSDRHPGWSGTVINITSISGLVKTAQHHFSYNASKAAANHLTRMLAAEIGAAGLKIRVNGIAPGVFPSEMTAGESDERQKSQLSKDKFEGKIPADRPGKDEDMASAILFIASNQYVNGHIVVVDGGYTLSAGM